MAEGGDEASGFVWARTSRGYGSRHEPWEAARIFAIDRRTVDKMLVFSVPPGYRRSKPVRRPKLDPFIGIIDQILETDTKVPKKQRHTSKRIFERLRDEHGFAGGITIVKDYIVAARQRQRPIFL